MITHQQFDLTLCWLSALTHSVGIVVAGVSCKPARAGLSCLGCKLLLPLPATQPTNFITVNAFLLCLPALNCGGEQNSRDLCLCCEVVRLSFI